MDRVQLLALAKLWAANGRAKQIREAARLSMGELGEQIGVEDSTVSRWESGKRAPSGDAGIRYAEALQALTEVCDDCGDGGYGPTGKTVTNAAWNGGAGRFSDEEYQMSCAVCETGDGTVKQRCHLPHHEPGGAINRNGVHAAAGRVGQIPEGVRSRAAAHLHSHYTQDLKEEPPDSLTAAGVPSGLAAQFPALAQQAGYAHGSFSGTHSHAHSPYGTQGGDDTHDHSHSHDGDNNHDHSHMANAAGEVLGRRPDMMLAGGAFRYEPGPEDQPRRAAWQAQLRYGITASGEPADLLAGQHWNVRQDQLDWYVNPPDVLLADTGRWQAEWQNPAGSYTEALTRVADQLAVDRPGTLPDTWRSEMAFEGRPTGDGRFIEPGAIEYRNCPLPLMLQTTTEQGHYGAVLAGAINATGKLGETSVGTGDYDDSPAGQQAHQIVASRGRFGVSIDVAEAEGRPVCSEHGDNLDECEMDCNWEAHFSLIRVMGLTLTPFPAFEDAYIENVAAAAQQPVAASAGTTAGYTYALGGNLSTAIMTVTSPPVEPTTDPEPDTESLVAAARQQDGPISLPAPSAWFRPPAWKPGDRHLVRQPSGGYACPLTVDPPDPAHGGLRRVYGHVADRLTCHTGIMDRCQLVPRSRSGYAAFNLRPLMTGDGQVIKVGHLTMGTGHADTNIRLTADSVRAHYDGGPGAVRMAYAAAGDDEWGPWVAGVIVPERTGDQVRDFVACSLSGDWREVWRGRGQELVAVLAGVTVPGFPVAASALIAAGVHVPQVPEIGPPKAGWRDNTMVALVAAGVVRQPMPWERQLAHLENEVSEIRDDYRKVNAALAPLRPVVAAILKADAAGESVDLSGLLGIVPEPAEADPA